MAPPSANIDVATSISSIETVITKNISPKTATSSKLDGPLTYSGSLNSFEQFDVTNVIGREFPKLQLSEILADDDKIRDLAILGWSLPHEAKGA